jgi:hypothetical protein
MSTEGVNHRAQLVDVYRLWWSHDAHWYQGVAKRFGQQVANEINAEALRQVAVQVGRRVARQLGELPEDHDLEELRRRYDECGERMFPCELRDADTQVIGDDLIELTLRRSFAITMLRMARSLEGYECPCTDIHAGWSEGLGVTLSENRATSCLRQGDAACRLLMRICAPAAQAAEAAEADAPGRHLAADGPDTADAASAPALPGGGR